MIYSPIATALSAALDRPDEWDDMGYVLFHRPSKISWWTANGAWFFDSHNVPSCLGLIERHFVWRKAKNLRDNIIAKRLDDARSLDK